MIQSTSSECVSHENLFEYDNRVRDSNGCVEAIMSGVGVEMTNICIVGDDMTTFGALMLKGLGNMPLMQLSPPA